MAPLDIESGAEKPPKKVFSDSSFNQGKFELKILKLCYKVSKKAADGSTDTKMLLTNVTAKAKAGEILAVVGPSGAGKSTFLDAIAGRIDPSSLEGGILINGKPIEPSFKRSSGYVMQDDALFPMLTVRETLMFSAKLRLPATMTSEEKSERVEMLISELGLQQCADTKIGNAEVRGVSGGEKRRVSIGVDLIHDPPVLFLDEPTSGLDSTSALNVVQNLHDIAEQRHRTIILTIHQPSFRILELIHNYLILARGNVIYHGPYAGMIDYFREFGRVIPDHVNALEYSLDLIEEQQNSEEGLAPLIQFRDSKSKDEVETRNISMLSSIGQLSVPEYANNPFSETAVLADRNFKNTLRTKELFGIRAGVFVVTALIIGSLFFNTKYTEKGITQRQSYFIFTLAALIFTSTEALPIFLDERQIYIRETSRGAYRTISYVVANAIVFLPFLFILAFLYSVVSYFMLGLYSDVNAFFIYVAAMFMVLAVTNSFVIFLGALVPNFIAGNTLVTSITAYFFLFSGFFIPKNGIPDYWIWLHYLSTFKYPLEIVTKNEYNRIHKCWKYKNGFCISSDEILKNLDVDDTNISLNFFIMVIFFLAYRVFFYIALRFQSASVRK